ncbi:uncharacterized protein LOC121290380 isoform X2 [Carcharodon carcharias]|uniref:uncharacterized protein LOC121290380 isoform X2 n=1 Tax=Carcharodon carcharias TaxID=13397 RepID=UPI001B7DB5F4|nr:uncharacterized protein LOC121290380 isoform X2 [Carcharodon carcharias]
MSEWRDVIILHGLRAFPYVGGKSQDFPNVVAKTIFASQKWAMIRKEFTTTALTCGLVAAIRCCVYLPPMAHFAEARELMTPRRKVVAVGLRIEAGLELAMLGVRRLFDTYRQDHPDPKLVKVAKASSLFIYSVKSCKGIPLTEVEVDESGTRKGPMKDRTLPLRTSLFVILKHQ